MATVLQKNGMKPLPNGNLGHLNIDKMDDVARQLSEVVQPVEQCVKDVNNDEPEIDIVINNVVCSFSVRCHLNLRQIALQGINVEYRREHGVSKI